VTLAGTPNVGSNMSNATMTANREDIALKWFQGGTLLGVCAYCGGNVRPPYEPLAPANPDSAPAPEMLREMEDLHNSKTTQDHLFRCSQTVASTGGWEALSISTGEPVCTNCLYHVAPELLAALDECTMFHDAVSEGCLRLPATYEEYAKQNREHGHR
jgi:hypothetical protein